MKLDEKSLPASNGFRPRPLVKQTADGKTVIAVTSWGSAEIAQKVVDSTLLLLEKSAAPAFDPDATRVGIAVASEPEPSTLEKKFVETIKGVNEELLKNENNGQWQAVVELVIIGVDQYQIYWAQAGQPQIFYKNSAGVQPICYTPDPSSVFQQRTPLPMFGIGLEKNPTVQSGSLPIEKTAEILLLSSPQAPAGIYLTHTFDINAILDLLSQNFPESPAWAAVLRP
jgi:hypothetical protein